MISFDQSRKDEETKNSSQESSVIPTPGLVQDSRPNNIITSESVRKETTVASERTGSKIHTTDVP